MTPLISTYEAAAVHWAVLLLTLLWLWEMCSDVCIYSLCLALKESSHHPSILRKTQEKDKNSNIFGSIYLNSCKNWDFSKQVIKWHRRRLIPVVECFLPSFLSTKVYWVCLASLRYFWNITQSKVKLMEAIWEMWDWSGSNKHSVGRRDSLGIWKRWVNS